MNVAIYARVSTEWQVEHGYSIGTQLEACRKKAESLGAFVVKEYVDDGYSGGFLERPALEQLRDAVQEGLYEAVIVHDADRLSRKLIHQLILVEEFEKYKCKPVFVLGEVADTP
jgi:site-specific DNA recombinase